MNLNENNFSELFALSRDAVVGIKDNKIHFINPAAKDLFSLDVGMSADSFLPEEFLLSDDSKCASAFTVNGKRAEVSMTATDGLVLLYLHPVNTQNTDYNLQLKTARSLSDSLMSIRMGLDIILRRLSSNDDPKLKAYASLIYREYYRLKRLCGHISTAANIAQGTLPCRFSTVDLVRTVRDLVESIASLATPLGINIQHDSSCRSAIISADKALLETMLLNLISNSMLRCHEGNNIRVILSKSRDRFILCVDDDGSGMDTGTFSNLFNENIPLPLADCAAGVGYGLIIARGIAERHDGNLLIESKENGGCRVRVSLPAKPVTEVTFNQHNPLDEINSMNNILTELAVVLPENIYTKRFFD